jgi:hypothetical protein
LETAADHLADANDAARGIEYSQHDPAEAQSKAALKHASD